MGIIVTGFLYRLYLRIYQRIPSLTSFSETQRRILTYQLLAISLWTIAGFCVLLYALWSFNVEILATDFANAVIAIINWAFLGFVAITSLVPGVSIISSIRPFGAKDPVQGTTSFFYGISLLGLLAYWTWRTFLTGL